MMFDSRKFHGVYLSFRVGWQAACRRAIAEKWRKV